MIRKLAITAALATTVLVANWLVTNVGIVPVGFGLMAPAGVWAAGAAFTIRDSLHEEGGIRWVLAGILIGAVLSLIVADADLAVASCTAFVVSELCDLAIYAPLRERHWLVGVALSNTIGSVVDSVLFLWLAFGSLNFLQGQVVGKWWVTAFAVAAVAGFRRPRDPQWTSG